jgi:hypothetical protein
MNLLRFSEAAFMSICLLGLIPTGLDAQEDLNSAQASPRRLALNTADRAAASNYSNYKVHTMAVKGHSVGQNSPASNSANPVGLTATPGNESAGSGLETGASDVSTAASTLPSVPAPGFYPGDLSYFGGPVIKSAESNPVYIDCAPSCWGNPAKFLWNFGRSQFAHITDQYVGSSTGNRYTMAKGASISFPIFGTLTDVDMLYFAYAAAKASGTGYHHIYHLFLPQGVDVCFAGTSICYSPDNPATFSFCAYHGSVDFSDIGHVLYSVEPYQGGNACSEVQPTPNGELIDSTANVLSHELVETITDPDIDAWFAFQSGGTIFEEIGDVCTRLKFDPTTFSVLGFYNPPTSLNGHQYAIQPEYSNKYHACSYAP